MDTEAKLDILMTFAADDREGRPGSTITLPPRLRHMRSAGALRPFNLRNVRMGPYGPKAQLLRILMTNACSFNCHYCPMRRDREMPRTLLKPEEMVRVCLDVFARGWASGVFITTGIPSRPVKVMDDLITVLELLRIKHAFRGYIHVKIVPGADDAQVDRITALASRISINLETPCGDSLTAIAPEKRLDTTLVALRRAQRNVVSGRHAVQDGRPLDALLPQGAAGITTQFVVGATADSDRTIIGKTVDLYADGGMHHAHFSAFRPIRDTPLENAPGASPLREHRLYQADHLLRRYRFTHDELVFDRVGNLTLAHDPKIAWALAHPEQFPLDVYAASYSALLRVPGIGPLVARRLVEQRHTLVLRGADDLRKLGVVMTRAQGFLALRGKQLSRERWKEQLSLWDAAGQDTVVRLGQRDRVFELSPGTFR